MAGRRPVELRKPTAGSRAEPGDADAMVYHPFWEWIIPPILIYGEFLGDGFCLV